MAILNLPLVSEIMSSVDAYIFVWWVSINRAETSVKSLTIYLMAANLGLACRSKFDFNISSPVTSPVNYSE